jgi:hypothetical protein
MQASILWLHIHVASLTTLLLLLLPFLLLLLLLPFLLLLLLLLLRRSSLSCCHSVKGDRYYAEPHYPSEPEYPAYAAMMIRRHRGDAELERVPPAQGPIAHTQIFDIPFDSPRRFYPRGGKAECLWSLAYHDAVVVDENTKQIGIASATW